MYCNTCKTPHLISILTSNLIFNLDKQTPEIKTLCSKRDLKRAQRADLMSCYVDNKASEFPDVVGCSLQQAYLDLTLTKTLRCQSGWSTRQLEAEPCFYFSRCGMMMLSVSPGTSDGPMGSCLSQPRPLASPFDQVLFHGNLSRRPRDYQCMVPPHRHRNGNGGSIGLKIFWKL